MVVGVKFLDGVDWLDAVGFHHLVGYKRVKGGNLHAETFGYACHVAAHLTVCVDAESLAFQLCS